MSSPEHIASLSTDQNNDKRLHRRCTIHLTLMMTSFQVVKTSVFIITNRPSQDYTHPDNHTLLIYDVTPGFKPFTVRTTVYSDNIG